MFSDNSTALTNKTKVHVPIDSEHKLHQKVLHTWIPMGIVLLLLLNLIDLQK